MHEKDFEVELVGRQRSVYVIRAPDAESARRIAAERWQRGEPSDVPGFQWYELESARAAECFDDERERQDDEVLLRFIRERERAATNSVRPLFPANGGDAASAFQVANDLGWETPGSAPGDFRADALRAARSLERLCSRRELVCFERSRSRLGERGEIRLYCTPEYLDRLGTAV